VPEVLEFYGSTEGNVSMFNFDGREGAIGRIPKWLRKRFNSRLIQYDVEAEEVVRGTDGLCIECGPGQVGQCVGMIAGGDARSEFSGYLDKSASEKKILQNVFERGDAWFATGDLMRMDADGYFYFVDRIGDTFRWKGENVSTNEVAEVLNTFGQVAESTVYGVQVPGTDGRAGMAAVVLRVPLAELDLTGFARHVRAQLPPYAVPVFLRFQEELEITGTFKQLKGDLKKQGFDPAAVPEPVFVLPPRHTEYVPMTTDLHRSIAAKELEF
jgi:fatty-acyl-CoA synthase